ncbi:LuxR C-terminal-related transcriptional regulator [Lysobacter sp. S4-A87]|uniref:LuxR C-terminal-related transcriptional regulator n=1 Tax=Lysobacter sp. S4-A87 TaxID=2925843 RepID=UPI001F535937|nr:LuxR C-terminal-related transcriptional regulator [Lysobacter sp. S4-A87]UNK49699.1 LuxR C-terminal-related transcriptional regulator [Lysobacter sp. S4-A87]
MERERLLGFWDDVNERTAIQLVAPAGFGKTTALLQWRRRWLEHGAIVAWVGCDDEDDPARFVAALSRAVRSASGRLVPGSPRSGIAALTDLLSEIAQRGAQTVIVIDEAERLPHATVRTCVQYLLLNAPANLSVAIGSRMALPLRVAELAAKGNLATLSGDDLRLRYEESLSILEKSLGPKLTLDERALLHETTEGWPIGLQLAIAMAEHDADPGAAVRSLSARRGHIQDYFVESLLSRLPASTVALLTRVAILDDINPELCELVSGQADGAAQLQQIIGETPIVVVGEDTEWIRLHPLARDFLLGRFEQLSRQEQAELHARVSHWYARHERYHEAARHALAAGDEAQAQAFASRSLWTLGTQGQIAEAREWLERIPAAMLARDSGLKLGAAFVLAATDRNAEALTIAQEVIDDPATSNESRVEALRVAAVAMIYADHLGLIPELMARWLPLLSEHAEPLYAVSSLNAQAMAALHAGTTRTLRGLLDQAAHHGETGSLRMAAGLSRMLRAMGQLWDGEPEQAAATLRQAVAQSELESGRRSMIASLQASVLAAALLRVGRPGEALPLLANRLDVIEQWGSPDNILLAYQTLARSALVEGDERRALQVLEEMDALAERRHLPRLRIHSLADRIRIYAAHNARETITALTSALDQAVGEMQRAELRPLLQECQLAAAIAKADAALARHAVDDAEFLLDVGDALAKSLRRHGDMRSIMVLRSVVAWKRGHETARPLLKEAIHLATAAGDAWLLVHAHPLALDMAKDWEAGVVAEPRRTRAVKLAAAPRPVLERPLLVRNGVLTSKESEVLGLLARGLSNKAIARILDVSGETVKWHLKNLFQKLSATTRKHAVDRARLLGLLQEG